MWTTSCEGFSVFRHADRYNDRTSGSSGNLPKSLNIRRAAATLMDFFFFFFRNVSWSCSVALSTSFLHCSFEWKLPESNQSFIVSIIYLEAFCLFLLLRTLGRQRFFRRLYSSFNFMNSLWNRSKDSSDQRPTWQVGPGVWQTLNCSTYNNIGIYTNRSSLHRLQTLQIQHGIPTLHYFYVADGDLLVADLHQNKTLGASNQPLSIYI